MIGIAIMLQRFISCWISSIFYFPHLGLPSVLSFLCCLFWFSVIFLFCIWLDIFLSSGFGHVSSGSRLLQSIGLESLLQPCLEVECEWNELM
jgi:hypothetical protein